MELAFLLLVGFAVGVIATWALLRWKAIASIGDTSQRSDGGPASPGAAGPNDPRGRSGIASLRRRLLPRGSVPEAALEAERDDLRARLADADAALAQAHERLGVVTEAHERDALRRETQLSDRRRIESLQAQLAARDGRLVELETEVNAQRRRLDVASAPAPAVGPALSAVQSALERARQQLAERDDQLSERDRRMAAVEAQRDAAVASAGELEADRHDLAIVRGQLADVQLQRDDAWAAAASAAMVAQELAIAREQLTEAGAATERLQGLRLELDQAAADLEASQTAVRERDDRLDELTRRLALAESRLADTALDSSQRL